MFGLLALSNLKKGKPARLSPNQMVSGVINLMDARKTLNANEYTSEHVDTKSDAKQKQSNQKVVKKVEKAQPKLLHDEKQVLTDAIRIPSKAVIEQKNALQLLLNRIFNGDIVCEKTFTWLRTPDIIEGKYENLYKSLSEYRGDIAFAKRNVQL